MTIVPAAHHIRLVRPSRCLEDAVTVPRVSGRLPTWLRFPQIAVAGSARYVVGVEGVVGRVSDTSATPRSALALRAYHVDRHEFVPAALRGDFVFAYPRSVVDRDGVLHVVWAEPDSADRRGLSDQNLHRMQFTTLWHAMFHDGRWSRPVAIYHAGEILWDVTNASKLIADSSGALALAFGANPRDHGGSVMAYLRFERHLWSVHELPFDLSPPIYVDLAALGPRQIVIAYVTTNPAIHNVKQPSNQLYVVRSTDAGQTWGDRMPLSQWEQGLAYQPRVVVDNKGTVHAVWIAGQNPHTLEAGALLHAISTDGSHWTAELAAPFSGLVSELQIAVDECDMVHVMITRVENGGLMLHHVRMPIAGVRTEDLPFAEPLFGPPSIMMDSGDLRVVWERRATGVADSGSVRPAVTMYGSIRIR